MESEYEISTQSLAIFAFMMVLGGAAVDAQTPSKPIKIGVLSDMSSLYADQAGVGSVEAAKMAIEDAGGTFGGQPIELVSADHQHKPMSALPSSGTGSMSMASMWSSICRIRRSRCRQQIVKEKNKIALYATAATTELTGKQCSPNGIQWVYDAYSNAAGLAKALVAKGDKSWYFLTVDHARVSRCRTKPRRRLRRWAARWSAVRAIP